MIFVDASAIVTVLGGEASADKVIDCLESSQDLITSPVAIFEAAVALTRIFKCTPEEASTRVVTFLDEAGVATIPIDFNLALLAVEAFQAYGKGRHPAKLNLGDCFAYAGARANNAELLFIGNDFTKTDVTSALKSPT